MLQYSEVVKPSKRETKPPGNDIQRYRNPEVVQLPVYDIQRLHNIDIQRFKISGYHNLEVVGLLGYDIRRLRNIRVSLPGG